MQIIEQSLIAKNPKAKSEDGLIVTNDFIAVIDGSTSKTSHRYCRMMSNGRYAMKLIARYILNMPANSSCHEFCTGVTKVIQKKYKQNLLKRLLDGSADPVTHPEERLTASAIIFSRLRREIWMIGDCQCMINGELYENPKPYEQKLAEMRTQKIHELMAEGKTIEEILSHDEARDSIIPQMLKEMKNQNVTYAVIDGFRIPEQLVPIIQLDFHTQELVFASDGYPFLCNTLKASESKLRCQRETDPLNIGDFKATKGFTPGNDSFDDRTYIRFSV